MCIRDSPNIVLLQDLFYEGKTVNLVMPLALVNLRDYIEKVEDKKKYSGLEEDGKTLLEFTTMLIKGVLHLHDSTPTLIHRDLKPENILIFDEGGREVVKIGEFGISKLLENRNYMETDRGTNPYKAPEVDQAQAYRKEVDIWSLGLVLYFLITGEDLFTDRNQVRKHKDEESCWKTRRRVFQTHSATKEIEYSVENMIKVDPQKRISLEKALRNLEMPGKYIL